MKKRAIIFDFKSITPISTYAAFYQCIEGIYDVTYYGPGYVDIDDLECSFEKIVDELGPFDIAFMHRTVHIYIEKNKTVKKNDFVHYLFDIAAFTGKKRSFGEDYDSISCPLVLVSMLVDLYCLPEWYIEKLANFPGYLMLPPPQCTREIFKNMFLHKESFYYRCDNRYFQFSQLYFDKIVPVAHLLCNHEFSNVDVQSKVVNVPGVPYYFRRRALSVLKEHGIKCLNKTLAQKSIELLHKSRCVSYGNPLIQNIYSNLFIRNISNAQLCFTDGSRLRIFIRKFIEIPAHGSVLIGDLFHDAKNFGFVDGLNCIQCQPDELPDMIHDLYSNKDRLSRLRYEGQRFILSNFTSSSFSRHILPILESIEKKTFKGAIWRNGELCKI
jgi:hypothetical protein